MSFGEEMGGKRPRKVRRYDREEDLLELDTEDEEILGDSLLLSVYVSAYQVIGVEVDLQQQQSRLQSIPACD